MKKPLLILSLAVAAVSLRADVYQLFWDKSKPSGSFTDETMWKTVQGGASPDFDKGVDRFFRVESKTGATNTVVLSDCNLRGGLNYYIWPTSSLILDGRGTWFRQHSADEAETVNNTVNYGPFTLRDNDYSMTAFNLKPVNIATDSTISFSNSLQRFDRTASPNALKWTMESGYFSFAEPNAANAAHTLVLDCNGTDKIESRVTVEIGKDAEVVFPKVEFQCLSTNGELVVDGGKLDVLGEFKMDTTASAAGWRDYVCTNYLTVRNGGRFRQLGGGTTFGLNGNKNKRVECITVTGSGSRYEIASTAGNVTTECWTDLNVLDGGVFETHKTMNMSAGYGASVDNKTRIVVSGAGSTFDAADGTLYLARKSEMVVEDGAEAVLYHGLTIGHDVSGGSGEDNDSPSMTISGDGTVVKMVSQSDGQTGVYVGNCTGTGTLNIEGGTLRGNTDANHIMMRIGAEYNSKGKGVVNMSGGTLLIGDGTYDQCVVGFRGDAEFNLSGGEVVAKCPLTFNYETTRATVPQGRVIRGTLTIPTAGTAPHPITVHVPGAGSGEWHFERREGRAYLILNVVDYPCFPDKDHPVGALYEEQNRRWSEKTGPGAACYYFHGDLSKEREDYFYYGAILGINRAVDWIAALPQIDEAKDFRYEGMSQGGAFGIYLSALNRHITRALLAEPAITDVCGMLVDGRQSGWPILPEQHEKRPFYANMMKILPYFDTVHFAPRVRVPVRCYVGFVDILCPPHAVWAGYNCLGSADKKMVNVPGLDHGRPRDLWYGAWKRCDQSW